MLIPCGDDIRSLARRLLGELEHENVLTFAPGENVAAHAAIQDIVTRIAVKPVISRVSDDLVLPLVAFEDIDALEASNNVFLT